MRTAVIWGKELQLLDVEHPTYTLPFKWAVCGRCYGKGTHVNEAVDGDGFTMEEWDEMGYEFQGEYMAGVYDVTCTSCNGRTTLKQPDEELFNADDNELFEELRAVMQADFAFELECEAERKMGA